MPNVYRYIGPKPIADRARTSPPGTVVASAGEVLRWAARSDPANARSGRVTATFVVDAEGSLRLADRHSEHVACAGGWPVLAAGEIVFGIRGNAVTVEEVSNQSTGYCPEPESWPAVASALEAIGLASPEGYTLALAFRRCPGCGQVNVVKESVFACAICGSDLPNFWNLGAGTEG